MGCESGIVLAAAAGGSSGYNQHHNNNSHQGQHAQYGSLILNDTSDIESDEADDYHIGDDDNSTEESRSAPTPTELISRAARSSSSSFSDATEPDESTILERGTSATTAGSSNDNNIAANNIMQQQLQPNNYDHEITGTPSYATRSRVRAAALLLQQSDSMPTTLHTQLHSTAFQTVVQRKSQSAKEADTLPINDKAEKRKWNDARAATKLCYDAAQTDQHQRITSTSARELLTAARRTPVKLVIPPNNNNNNNNNNNATTTPQQQTTINHSTSTDSGTDSSTATLRSLRPRKMPRGTAVTTQDDLLTDEIDDLSIARETSARWEFNTSSRRPSLNFDKMRERMMRPGHASRKHEGFRASKAKMKAWNISCASATANQRAAVGFQFNQSPNESTKYSNQSASCVQLDCVFKPVDPTADTTGDICSDRDT